MYDAPVHIYKTVLMQRLLDAVSHGYYWHTSGTVPLNKAQRLADKFADRYGVHRNANQRAHAKRQGRSNARLFLYAPPDSDMLMWWLVATKGEGAIHQEERMKDATNSRQRLRIGNNYEIVRRTRPSNKGGGTVWSWRMTSECIGQWRERIIQTCRKTEPLAITQAVGSLYRVPGFSGIREQVGKLVTLVRSEWRRRHGSLEGLVLPPVLPYVERLADTDVTILVLNKKLRL